MFRSSTLLWWAPYLFSSVDDVLGVRQPVHARSPDNWVMSRRGMSHFHGAELQKGFSEGHSTEKHLSKKKEESNILKEALTLEII